MWQVTTSETEKYYRKMQSLTPLFFKSLQAIKITSFASHPPLGDFKDKKTRIVKVSWIFQEIGAFLV